MLEKTDVCPNLLAIFMHMPYQPNKYSTKLLTAITYVKLGAKVKTKVKLSLELLYLKKNSYTCTNVQAHI